MASLLEKHPEWKVRVLLVWEPVRPADRHGPPPGTYARVPDARVVQFWDPGLALSKRIVREVLDDPTLLEHGESITKSTIVWDVAVVHRPGQQWNGAFPRPAYYGAPVVDVIREVEQAVESAGATRTAGSAEAATLR